MAHAKRVFDILEETSENEFSEAYRRRRDSPAAHDQAKRMVRWMRVLRDVGAQIEQDPRGEFILVDQVYTPREVVLLHRTSGDNPFAAFRRAKRRIREWVPPLVGEREVTVYRRGKILRRWIVKLKGDRDVRHSD